MRWVKHAEELAVMRALGALTDWCRTATARTSARRLTQELDHAMSALMVEEAARRFPGEDFDIPRWTLAGPASASPHGDGAACGARIAEGDTVVNLILPRLNGYYVENERTGSADARMIGRRACTVAAQATDAAVQAAVTGQRVCDMDAAAQAVIERAGFGDYVFHRTGHAVGLMLHEYPEDMAFNTRGPAGGRGVFGRAGPLRLRTGRLPPRRHRGGGQRAGSDREDAEDAGIRHGRLSRPAIAAAPSPAGRPRPGRDGAQAAPRFPACLPLPNATIATGSRRPCAMCRRADRVPCWQFPT